MLAESSAAAQHNAEGTKIARTQHSGIRGNTDTAHNMFSVQRQITLKPSHPYLHDSGHDSDSDNEEQQHHDWLTLAVHTASDSPAHSPQPTQPYLLLAYSSGTVQLLNSAHTVLHSFTAQTKKIIQLCYMPLINSVVTLEQRTVPTLQTIVNLYTLDGAHTVTTTLTLHSNNSTTTVSPVCISTCHSSPYLCIALSNAVQLYDCSHIATAQPTLAFELYSSFSVTQLHYSTDYIAYASSTECKVVHARLSKHIAAVSSAVQATPSTPHSTHSRLSQSTSTSSLDSDPTYSEHRASSSLHSTSNKPSKFLEQHALTHGSSLNAAEKRLRQRMAYPFEWLGPPQTESASNLYVNISAGYHCQSCIILFHRRFLSTDHIHSVQLLTQSGYDNSAAQSNSQTAASKLYHELLSQAPANLQQTAASQAYQAPTFTSSTTTTSSNTQSSRHAHHNSSAQAAATLTSNLFPSTANSKEFSGTRLLLCTNEQAFLYDISNGTTLADYSFESDLVSISASSYFLFALTTATLEIHTLWHSPHLQHHSNKPTLLWAQPVNNSQPVAHSLPPAIAAAPAAATVLPSLHALFAPAAGALYVLPTDPLLLSHDFNGNSTIIANSTITAQLHEFEYRFAAPLAADISEQRIQQLLQTTTQLPDSARTAASRYRFQPRLPYLLCFEQTATLQIATQLYDKAVGCRDDELAYRPLLLECFSLLRLRANEIRHELATVQSNSSDGDASDHDTAFATDDSLQLQAEVINIQLLLQRVCRELAAAFSSSAQYDLVADFYAASNEEPHTVLAWLERHQQQHPDAAEQLHAAYTLYLLRILAHPTAQVINDFHATAGLADRVLKHLAAHAPTLFPLALLRTFLFCCEFDGAFALTMLQNLDSASATADTIAASNTFASTSTFSSKTRSTLSPHELSSALRALLQLQLNQESAAITALKSLPVDKLEQLLVANVHVLTKWRSRQALAQVLRAELPWSLLQVLILLTQKHKITVSDAIDILQGDDIFSSISKGESVDPEHSTYSRMKVYLESCIHSYLQDKQQQDASDAAAVPPESTATRTQQECLTQLLLLYINAAHWQLLHGSAEAIAEKHATQSTLSASLARDTTSPRKVSMIGQQMEQWSMQHVSFLQYAHALLQRLPPHVPAMTDAPAQPSDTLKRLQALLCLPISYDTARIYEAILQLPQHYQGKLSLLLLVLPAHKRFADAFDLCTVAAPHILLEYGIHHATTVAQWRHVTHRLLQCTAYLSAPTASYTQLNMNLTAQFTENRPASTTSDSLMSLTQFLAQFQLSEQHAAVSDSLLAVYIATATDANKAPTSASVVYTQYLHVYVSLLEHLLQRYAPADFLQLIPAAGSTAFFLPFIERNFSYWQPYSLTAAMKQLQLVNSTAATA